LFLRRTGLILGVMPRLRALPVALLFVLDCSSQPTGLIVDVNMAGFEADELQYGVSVASPPDAADMRVLVDPSGKGRVHGKFHGHDRERQPIYVADDNAGMDVICEVTGLSGGVVIATGYAAGNLKAHELTEVTVILEGAPDLPGRGQKMNGGGGTGRDAAVDEPPARGNDGGGESTDAAADSSPSGGGNGGAGAGGSGGTHGSGGSSGSGGGGTTGGNPGSGGAGGGGNNGSGGTTGGTGGRAGSGGSPGGSGGHPGGTGGSPGAPHPKGAACHAGADCASGFCTDGVCCSAPCIGGCRSCNDPRSPGDCRLSDGHVIDPRARCAHASGCGTDGTCDGNGGCALTPAGKACGAASCKNGNFLVPAPTCDGAGQCVSPVGMQKCDKNLACVAGVCL